MKERLSLQVLQFGVVIATIVGLGLYVHRQQLQAQCQAKQDDACLTVLSSWYFPNEALRNKVAEQVDRASATFKNQGKLDKAEAVLDKACSRHLASSCKSLAWFLTLNGKKKQGVTAMKKACQFDRSYCSSVADLEDASEGKNSN